MATSNFSTISATVLPDGMVCVLELTRPARLNALSLLMTEELSACLDSLVSSSVRVLILRGAANGFCSGADLSESINEGEEDVLLRQQRFSNLILKIARLPQVVICAVHGAAAGGGMALAMASDIRLASTDASFSAAFLRIGLGGCELGSSFFLPRLIGLGNAAFYLMTGDAIDGTEAFRLGLVQKLYPARDELFAAAEALARKIVATTSRLGLRITKQGLRLATEGAPSLEAVIHSEDKSQMVCLHDAHAREFLVEATKRFRGGRGGQKSKL